MFVPLDTINGGTHPSTVVENMAKTQFRGWYFEQNGRKIGPVTTEAIAGLIALGVLKPTDPVWKGSKGGRKTHFEATKAVLVVSPTSVDEPRKS